MQKVEVIEVPPKCGKTAFLKTVDSALQMPKVLEIKIAAGVVTVTREVENDEPMIVEFDDLTPGEIIRSLPIQEVGDVAIPFSEHKVLLVLASILKCCNAENLLPIAFVIGVNSVANEWMFNARKESIGEFLLGVRVVTDRDVPDDSIFLCGGVSGATEIQKSAKCFRYPIPLEET